MPFHIVQRGNNRAPCFATDRDRLRYLDELATLARSGGVAVHAYVLMTNHVHLLATAEASDGIAALMQFLGQRYAQYFNRTHERTGTLWEGRYWSSLVDSDGYLLTCHRYIEANPVRAGMVSTPADYRWSSHRANALGESNPLLSPHLLLEALGGSAEERRENYRRLFDCELPPAELAQIRQAARGGFALGRPEFVEQMSRTLQLRVGRIGQGRSEKRRVESAQARR